MTKADFAAPPKDIDFMTSLARGLAVLRSFEGQRSLTISQAAAATGLSRAAARRCLYTLAKLGYIGTIDGKAYELRPALLPLARAYIDSHSFAEASQPVLMALRDKLGESCSLGIRDGDDIFYLARAETTRIMSIALGVGSRLPAYCSSMGRVLLAQLSPEALEAYLLRTPLLARTSHTITDPAKLRTVIAQVRADGFAIIDEELEVGLRSIAVPVLNRHGACIAALNVGAPAARASVNYLKTVVLPALQDSAARVGSLSI